MTKAHWQRLVLTIASAGTMGLLDFDPGEADQGSLGFFLSLAILLVALRGAGGRWGFRLGFIWGVISYGLTLSWFWTIFQGIAAGLWCILAFFPAVFGSWFGAVTAQGKTTPLWTKNPEDRPSTPLWIIPLAAIVWTGLEYYRCEWFILRFPWITPGTIMRPNALTPLIGTYGITFLIMLVVASIARDRPRGRSQAVALGIFLATIFGFIVIRETAPDPTKPPADNARTIALVQSEMCYFDPYLELSETIDVRVDAIIWPEYALPEDIRKKPAQMAAVRTLLQQSGAKFLTVGSRTDIDDIGNYYNTAITIGPDSVLGTHYKNRTVHFFADGEPGESLNAISTPIGRIATPVCFDCDYTAVSRRLVLDGTEVFLVPSMDAEHWTARQHEQHAQLFRHRAAENRRWFAVSATSGVTQLIDPHGTLVSRLPTMTEGVLIGQVATRSDLTVYTRFGWILGPACTFATAAILLITIVTSIRQRRQSTGK